ncbi:hypothetical protein Ahy_A09g046743 [Arachis hypogaea]|uniref:thymidine kinase n=1 Tax=Arachis hypogaea TaxID=3818 RepID=A0A445BQN7_ARAHY|nr:hypothetical protein Ahy_A09g046743 [Arachis hypogaea]
MFVDFEEFWFCSRMAHSDDDVLGLGNKALSGTKRKSPDDSSEEEKEKEDKGFQVESPDNNNKRPRTEEENVLEEEEQNQLGELGCSPDVANQMMNHSRFLLLLKRYPLEARDYSLMTETRNLIGQVQFLAMNVSEYPDFSRQFPEAGRIPCVTLFHGFQVLAWCPMDEGGSILAPFAAPLYFALRDFKEVMPTEQPCDLAYEFGDGLFDVKEFPQGFPKTDEFCCKAADEDGKIVIVAGLDGDYLRKSFGSVLHIIPLADTELCCKRAFFTLRKTQETQTELIAGSDVYMPVCRYHYINSEVVTETSKNVLESVKRNNDSLLDVATRF